MRIVILIMAFLLLVGCAPSSYRGGGLPPCGCMDPNSPNYDPTASHPSDDPWKKR